MSTEEVALGRDGSGAAPNGEQAKVLLDQILGSSHFRDSPRLSTLLRYLVREELAGQGDRLNAYSVAFDVYGRDETFDPAIDSIVRVEMLRLRQRLAAWHDDPANVSGWQVEIPQRSYRPRFFFRESKGSPQPTGSLRSQGWMSKWPYIAALLVLGGSIWGYWALRQNQECESGRPEVVLPERVTGEAPKASQDLLKRLKTFLNYYPLLHPVEENEVQCPGTPRYALQIAKSDHGLTADLSRIEGKNLLLHQEFALSPAPKGEDGAITMAQIAYVLGHDSGVVPLDASRQPWSNLDAQAEYRCLMQSHDYFNSNATPANYPEIRQCLRDFLPKTQKADVPAMLAAIEWESNYTVQTPRDAMSDFYFKQAIAKSEQIDPYNTELLTVKLRQADFGKNANHGNAQIVIQQMTDLYPYEPHILNQVAQAQCKFTRDYYKAFKNIERVKLLTINESIDAMPFHFANIYCNFSSGNSLLNKKFVPEILLDSTPFMQMVALDYGHIANDSATVSAALARLKELNCDSRACLTLATDEVANNPDFRGRLQNIIDIYFPETEKA